MTTETINKDSIRLQKVLDALKISAHSFSQKLNYKSSATIYHVLNDKNTLSAGLIDKIVNQFPNVSYSFLKDGEGEVLLDETGMQNQMNFFNIGNNQKSQFEKFSEIPDKIDILIEQQFRTNELLEQLLENKK